MFAQDMAAPVLTISFSTSCSRVAVDLRWKAHSALPSEALIFATCVKGTVTKRRFDGVTVCLTPGAHEAVLEGPVHF